MKLSPLNPNKSNIKYSKTVAQQWPPEGDGDSSPVNVMLVESPPYRIVARWQKRAMTAGAFVLILGTLIIVLLWLLASQGIN